MRLFTSIEPSLCTLPQLSSLCRGVPSIRWCDPNQLHLTLVFIGEVPDSLLEPIAEALSAVEFEAFELECRQLGCNQSGIIWLGVEPCPPLMELQRKQLNILRRLPLVSISTRRYHPRWTLGRFRRQQQPDLTDYINQHQGLSLRIAVDRYLLKSSRLFSQGAQHRSEFEFLAG